MKHFDIRIRVPAKHLTTVLEVITGTADILEMKQIEAEALEAEKPKRVTSYVGGVRNKGIKGSDLILESLAKGPMSGDALGAIFVSRGFAAGSWKPTMSLLIRAGQVIKNGRGYMLKEGA